MMVRTYAMKFLGVYLSILGLVLSLSPSIHHYNCFIRSSHSHSNSALKRPTLFFAAADDSVFMGFGSKYSADGRNEADITSGSYISEISKGSEASDAGESKVLELPPPTEDGVTHRLEVDGAGVAMPELGPIIVNTDGTLRRIENWAQLTKAEQASTFRMVARRNKKRLEALKELEQDDNIERS